MMDHSLTRNRFLLQSFKSVQFAANHSTTFPDHFNLEVLPFPIYSPDVVDQNLNPIINLSQDGHPCSETCHLLPVNTGSWHRWALTSTTSPMRALKGCRRTQNQALCGCYVCMFTSKVFNSICCLVLESFCAAGLLKSHRWKQLPLAVGIVFNGNYENKSKSQSCEQIKTQSKQAKIWQTYLC